MELLQPLPLEKWVTLRSSLKREWPLYAYYYSWVNNAIKWKRKEPELELEIFCPYGKVDSGTFIGINSSSLYIVVIFTFEESKDLLFKVLTETEIIDWTQNVMFAAVHQHFKGLLLNALHKLRNTKSVKIECETVTNYFFKPKEECAEEKFIVPQECKIKRLDISHVPLVHSLWPHRNTERPELSTKFLETMVKLNRGLGLFLKEDNSLVSWVLHSDWGGLGMLQTVDKYKCKGYGKVIVQAMIKELSVEEDLDSILFVVDDNIPSEKLFKSLGYIRLTSATWIY